MQTTPHSHNTPIPCTSGETSHAEETTTSPTEAPAGPAPAPGQPCLKALKAALPRTLPILTGFLFLGLAYGVYMNLSGFSFWYPMVMSAVIFGGSLEFIVVSLLLGPFAPAQAFLLALLIQARHLFYGLSMLDNYRDMGWKKPYLVFGLCDESFSINYTAEIPPEVDRGWFFFFVTLLNHCYWVAGATIGGIAGSYLHIDTNGLEFVMTAMFVTIFMSQWKKEKQHYTGLIGLAVPALCLALLGSHRFMLPAMACIVLLLTICQTPLENAESRAWAKARQNQGTAPAAYDDPAQANRQGGLPK